VKYSIWTLGRTPSHPFSFSCSVAVTRIIRAVSDWWLPSKCICSARWRSSRDGVIFLSRRRALGFDVGIAGYFFLGCDYSWVLVFRVNAFRINERLVVVAFLDAAVFRLHGQGEALASLCKMLCVDRCRWTLSALVMLCVDGSRNMMDNWWGRGRARPMERATDSWHIFMRHQEVYTPSFIPIHSDHMWICSLR